MLMQWNVQYCSRIVCYVSKIIPWLGTIIIILFLELFTLYDTYISVHLYSLWWIQILFIGMLRIGHQFL